MVYPSQRRYNEKHPSLSFRVSSEERKIIKDFLAANNITLREIALDYISTKNKSGLLNKLGLKGKA